MNARLVLITGLSAVLGGCVLPFPTQYVAAPSVRGKVVNAKTGSPVDFAGVTVKGHKTASVLTKRDGTFATDTIMGSRPFWIWNPLAKSHTGEVELQIARPGYEKRNKVVKWTEGTQRMVHLAKPIRLRPKGMEQAIKDALGE